MNDGRDLSTATLIALGRKAQRGDPVAREEFARRITPIVALSAQMEMGEGLRRHYSLGDLCQDAFTRVFAALPRLKLRDEASLRSWLRVVVRNTVRDLSSYLEAKRRNRSHGMTGRLEDAPTDAATPIDPSNPPSWVDA